jgi:hypothetical protein
MYTGQNGGEAERRRIRYKGTEATDGRRRGAEY